MRRDKMDAFTQKDRSSSRRSVPSRKVQRNLLRIPDRFLDAHPSKINDDELRKFVDRYLSGWNKTGAEGWGLALTGPNGVGKSWSLAAILNYVLARNLVRSGIFVLADDFFRKANPMAELNLGDEAFAGDELWSDYYRTVPLLVICDLGKEDRRGKMAETAPMILGSVLRDRVQAQRITMFDTNLSLRKRSKEESVLDVYGASIFDLMMESMGMIEVGGASLREKKQKRIRRILRGGSR